MSTQNIYSRVAALDGGVGLNAIGTVTQVSAHQPDLEARNWAVESPYNREVCH